MSQKAKSPKSPSLDLSKSNQIAKLEDVDLNQLTSASGPVLKRINALKNEQLRMLELEAKFYEELHELECKYERLYQPFYQKRKTIVTGEYEPSEEEGKWALDEEEKKENGTEIDESKLHESGKELLKNLKAQFHQKEAEKGIPNFWLETLQSFRITAELIQEHDEPILAFLQDIRVNLFDKKPYGYNLEFEFAENPYFSNKTLTKTYELKTDVDPKDPFSFEGPDLEKSIGCKIDWKAGKNVTVKSVKKKIKPRNKKGVPKIITKEEKQDSFFNFFDTPKKAADEKALVKAGDEDFSDEEGDEELYMIADFEIGQYIREKIVPKAVLYYTGELDDMDEDDYEYDDEEDEDEDDDEDHDDEDDDDEDDDDEDDNDDETKKGKSGKKVKPIKGKGGKGPEPTPAECKQN